MGKSARERFEEARDRDISTEQLKEDIEQLRRDWDMSADELAEVANITPIRRKDSE